MNPDLVSAWDKVESRYADIDGDIAQFNVALLRTLRPRWQTTVRPDTSMFTLQFTRADTTGYTADEGVEVMLDAEDRVRMAPMRNVRRRGETRPVGPVTVTGDFTRPDNAVPAVEALLFQIAVPTDR